jgi:hypothetical protein
VEKEKEVGIEMSAHGVVRQYAAIHPLSRLNTPYSLVVNVVPECH